MISSFKNLSGFASSAAAMRALTKKYLGDVEGSHLASVVISYPNVHMLDLGTGPAVLHWKIANPSQIWTIIDTYINCLSHFGYNHRSQVV